MTSDKGIIIDITDLLLNSVINLNKTVAKLWLCHLRVYLQIPGSLSFSLSNTVEKRLQLWQKDIRQMQIRETSRYCIFLATDMERGIIIESSWLSYRNRKRFDIFFGHHSMTIFLDVFHITKALIS